MFDSDSEDSSVSRRSVLRTAAASTAGLTLTGSAGGQEFVPDDPAPGPNVTFLGFDCDPDREEFYTEVSREPTHDFGESEVVELDSGRGRPPRRRRTPAGCSSPPAAGSGCSPGLYSLAGH